MTNDIDNMNAATTNTWQLNALTEALGDLTLTVTDSLSVGRGSDNDLVLGSKQISRNHAQLSVLNGQLYVTDLESSNGTFINDERIAANESKHLAAEDTLGFASFSFQVSAPVAATVIHEQAVADKPTLMLSPDTEIAPIVEAEPVVKETIIEEILPVENTSQTTPVATMPVADVQAEPVDSAAQMSEPVVKETGITDILAAADKAEPVLSEVEYSPTETSSIPSAAAEQEVTQSTPTGTVPTETMSTPSAHQELLVEPPVLADEPVLHKVAVAETLSETSLGNAAPVVEAAIEPEHDKTTKTALQEEADPDVLRAKQTATSQFSGTANLGQSRDLGTTGNNAMDQALDNPATTGSVEKKPSGSWFIWVFVAIIIIGLALWLFNTGML
ncbi:FHA domain-containing protein [Psychrobacter sp. DD43]|uniref:FHA domain-containing protein n=1 Tax=Psychrobacter sp. DD43 TaxID=2774128 RepID=UPI0019195E1B|nr:FHA domain-containing protein [Psychrobacter sp. DD43]